MFNDSSLNEFLANDAKALAKTGYSSWSEVTKAKDAEALAKTGYSSWSEVNKAKNVEFFAKRGDLSCD